MSTKRWVLQAWIRFGVTVRFEFEVSKNTVWCDGIQFCIRKVMIITVHHIILILHECQKETLAWLVINCCVQL